jgi:hypothetical protein
MTSVFRLLNGQISSIIQYIYYIVKL